MSQVLTLWNKTSALPPGQAGSSGPGRAEGAVPFAATIRPPVRRPSAPNYAELVRHPRRRSGRHIPRDRARLARLYSGLARPMGSSPRRRCPATSGGSPRGWTSATPPRRPGTSPASPRPTPSSGPRTTPTCPCGSRRDGRRHGGDRRGHQALGDAEAPTPQADGSGRSRPRRPSEDLEGLLRPRRPSSAPGWRARSGSG